MEHDETDYAALEQEFPTLREALREIDRLRDDCAAAYQIVGSLAADAGVFQSEQVGKVLDNLTAAASGEPRPHDYPLPFAPEPRKS